jgi:Flp pilus assembly protein TadD
MTRALAAALAVLVLLAVPAAAMAPEPVPAGESASADMDYVRGVELIEAGRYAEAVTLMRLVVNRNPENADAWSRLGFAARKSGDRRNGELYYGKALALDPGHRETMEYLGEMYLESGRPDLARTMLARLEGLCPRGCAPRAELEAAIAAFDARKQ